MNAREILLACFQSALAAVDGRCVVRDELTARPLRGDWHVVAVGKAAGAMAHGALDVLGPRVAGGCIVVPPGQQSTGFEPQTHGLVVHVGAHPMPDASSLAAGAALVRYVAGLADDAQVLFLVAGGASSLVEWPRPGVGLDEIQACNRWALQSGAPITQINALRRRLSRLKGGGLARIAGPRRMRALLLSDVPGDDPRVIGSGLLHAFDDDGLDEVLEASAPAALRPFLHRAGRDPGRAGPVPLVPVRIVASLRQARNAAARAAAELGYDARVVRARFAGDAEKLGVQFAAALRRLPANVVQVRGGESTVHLPTQPGRGGRNQHLALAAALELERRGPREAHLLAAGTDGIDGHSSDAGALVDAGSCQRGRDGGIDPEASLRRADSGTFLEAAGDLLHTGATLTNVGDLVLGLRLGVHR